MIGFKTTYESGPVETADWWKQNFNLDSYYNYRSILEAIHHYDIAAGKNYFYYLNPETNKWETLPWDIDLTWANNMFGRRQRAVPLARAGDCGVRARLPQSPA